MNGESNYRLFLDNTPNAKLKMWKSLEVNGVIFVWYHVDDEEPEWQPENIDEISSGKWQFYGRTEHYANCHMQEIPENGADVAHLNQIHSSSVIGSGSLENRHKWFERILKHEWIANWSPCPAPNQHMSTVETLSISKIFGFKIFELNFNIKQIGPAYVEIRIKCNLFTGMEGVLLQLVKPIGPMRNSIIHNFYFNNSIINFIFFKFLLFSMASMVNIIHII